MQTLPSIAIDHFLDQIVTSVFDSMLQISVSPVEQTWPPQETIYTSAVEFGSGPATQIRLHLQREQAMRLTAFLMPISEPEDMTEDVFDAMREVVNMVGGNVKAVMAPGSRLSIAAAQSDPMAVEEKVMSYRAYEAAGLGLFWFSLVKSSRLQ